MEFEKTGLHEFDFENLAVYQQSLDFAGRLFSVCETLPIPVDRTLGDQLRRAALSIPNNIAEGSNKRTANAKAQGYGYALDSARECVPMLSLLLRRQLFSEQQHLSVRTQCLSICKMLRGLIRAVSRG
ncbi:MAG: four helix bundle protein [Candidatus Omnitrophica bacterium]|nr:four helix bundle protein [Candidatus Omnitrophota bacterium]